MTIKMTMKKFCYLLAVFMLLACGSSDSVNANDTMENGDSTGTTTEESITLPTQVVEALAAPMSTLTQDVKDAITFMYSEEGLAHDVYLNVYVHQVENQLTLVKELQNIATKSEVKHIDAVNQLTQKYDLNITKYPDTDHPYSTDDLARYGSGEFPVEPIQELYNILYDKGIQSKKDALEVGCMVEVVDVDDLIEHIHEAEASNATDVVDVFNFLLEGSYKHFWAFDEGLKNIGITEGCCSVPDYGDHTMCHPEYPNN